MPSSPEILSGTWRLGRRPLDGCRDVEKAVSERLNQLGREHVFALDGQRAVAGGTGGVQPTPWQHQDAEWLIDSIRREFLDILIVLNAPNL